MTRYATLSDLHNAFQAGHISQKQGYFLILDNDSVSLWDNDGEVFEIHPEQLLRDALDLLDIPWENV